MNCTILLLGTLVGMTFGTISGVLNLIATLIRITNKTNKKSSRGRFFIEEASEKLFGIAEAKAAQEVAKAAPTPVNVDAANKAAIADYVENMNLTTHGLAIGFEAASSTVIVQGMADTQETKEKILLCCGNVHGVE